MPVGNKSKKYIFAFSVVFLLWQLFAAYNYYFYSGWDAGLVLAAAEGYADAWYLSQYPNNIVLIWLFSKLLKISVYFSLIAFQCLISWFMGLLLWQNVWKLTGSEKTGLAAYVLYILLIGFSPWVSIPYSDSVGLLFPMLLLFLFLMKPQKKWQNILRWAVLGFLGFMAYKVKPQAAIVFIAVLIVEIGRKNKYAFFSFVGILCGVLAVNLITASFNIEIDKEAAFGPAHFLMMGLNGDTSGMYSPEDVAFSGSFATAAERNRADLNRAGQRIRTLGFSGLIKHVFNKLKLDFSDGTFAWGGEGNFVRSYVDEKIPHVSAFIRSFYYPGGEHYNIWRVSVQIIWSIVLCLSVLGLFFKPDPVTLLSLLGILAFCILFETRARYLYLNVPVFIISASYGMKGLFIHED